MKKSIIVIVIAVLSISTILFLNLNKKEVSDQIKFKQEYESLNGKYDEERKHDYVTVDIKEDNKIKYATYDEIVSILNGKTGIIYLGFKECPWCRNAIPVLIDAADELQIDTIYYYDALPIRDKKTLNENGEIVVEKEGAEEYKKLVELMYDFLPPYKELNDESIKRIYFPTVVFVKDGEIVKLHKATVESQKDPYKELTEEERLELKQIYSDGINKAYDIVCDEAC